MIENFWLEYRRNLKWQAIHSGILAVVCGIIALTTTSTKLAAFGGFCVGSSLYEMLDKILAHLKMKLSAMHAMQRAMAGKS